MALAYTRRRAKLGVDPRLVLVFELNSDVDLEEFRKADLVVLDSGESKVVIAFATDPQLAAFQERLSRYRDAEVGPESQPPLFGFFDAIDDTRELSAADRMTPRLREALPAAEEGTEMRLDVECWHPGEEQAALGREWVNEVQSAIAAAGGRVADSYVNAAAGLGLLRAYVVADQVPSVAELDQIARVDLIPQPLMWPSDIYTLDSEQLPQVTAPPATAPVVGVVDSGVASAHPLLGPALEGVEVLDGLFPDGEDESGHGTRIASLVLHGRLDEAVARGGPLRPFCKVLSVRVLDAEDQFPLEVLWEKELEKAIRYCAGAGARVINVSIADDGSIYRAPRATPVAALLDQLARELQLVLVVSAGNVPVAAYADSSSEIAETYPLILRDAAEAALTDPAPAALAITVGATAISDAGGATPSSEVASRIPLGRPEWPSPFSRHGPGIAGAIKPELSAPGGSLAFEHSMQRLVSDPELQVVAAGGGNFKARQRRLETCVGTSYAAPLVARVAAAVVSEHPEASPNLVRSLVLQSRKASRFVDALESGTEGERRDLALDLVGYGSPDLADAIASSDHRAVLVAQDAIPMEGVHIFEVPIPQSFFESGGTRGITVALAYDPPTRARRLDYLASRMEFLLFRGVHLELLERLILKASSEELETLDGRDGEEGERTESDRVDSPQKLSDLSSKQRIPLQPSGKRRSRGANQLAGKTWSQKLSPEDGDHFLLVVKNTNRWDDDHAVQTYAVSVVFERDDRHPALYADLEAQLRVEVELEARV